MTSLPSLAFGQVPPISIEEFDQDAKKQLSDRHFKLLNEVDIQETPPDGKGNKNIESLIKDVKTDLSEIRSAKSQNRQHKLERLPKAVLAGNPLECEKQIMKWQWEELDSIEAGKTFTMTEVLAYKLKLQILIRLHSFDTEKGGQVLDSVVNPSKNGEGK